MCYCYFVKIGGNYMQGLQFPTVISVHDLEIGTAVQLDHLDGLVLSTIYQ